MLLSTELPSLHLIHLCPLSQCRDFGSATGTFRNKTHRTKRLSLFLVATDQPINAAQVEYCIIVALQFV